MKGPLSLTVNNLRFLWQNRHSMSSVAVHWDITGNEFVAEMVTCDYVVLNNKCINHVTMATLVLS